MSMLPRVTDPTRERISREFDNLGPDVCMADIRRDLVRHNPQLLDMAVKWAGEGKEGKKLFTAFGMFYRLLAAEASAPVRIRRPQSAASGFLRNTRPDHCAHLPDRRRAVLPGGDRQS